MGNAGRGELRRAGYGKRDERLPLHLFTPRRRSGRPGESPGIGADVLHTRADVG
jgi:hypothetical protein